MITSQQLRTVLVLGSISGILFGSYSYLASDVGAWAYGEGKPYSCRETAGSSADDEVVLVGLWTLIFPALIRLSRFAQPIHLFERGIFLLLSVLLIVFISAATGCADFVFTAKHTALLGLMATLLFWLIATLLYLLPNPRRSG
jgi:hypothetical protein